METTFRQQVPNGSLSFDTLKQGIQFRDVTFQYRHGDRPAIQQLSFHIPSGKTTAFVGPSGSGKSTILGLILRRFDPTQGIIEVDGKLLTSYDLNSWHQRIATVSQNIYLFNRSVRENIAYGWPEATDADIITSAQMADAHDFIMAMPQGYNTVLGDRGVRLSGGQRQRLALARCLLRNPQILILDEATNALDSLSETFIQETLVRLWHDRTVIIVAHRLSTIEQADQILVIDAGQVVEQGTLPELLNQAGLFAQMYRLQTTSDQNPLAEGH